MKKLLFVLLVLLAVVPCAFGKSYVDEITDMTYAEAQKLNIHLQEVPFLMVHCECCGSYEEEFSDMDANINFGIKYIVSSEIRKSPTDYKQYIIKIKFQDIMSGSLSLKSEVDYCYYYYNPEEEDLEGVVKLNTYYTFSMGKTLLVGEFLGKNMEAHKCKKNPIKFPDARMCSGDANASIYQKWYADAFKGVQPTEYEAELMAKQKNEKDSVEYGLTLLDLAMKVQGINKNSNTDFEGEWEAITKNNDINHISLSFEEGNYLGIINNSSWSLSCEEKEGYLLVGIYTPRGNLSGSGVLYKEGNYLVYSPIDYGNIIIKFRR